MSGPCAHPDFKAQVKVFRLEDTGRFSAEVLIECAACGLPFQFLGLPAGLLCDGAAVSVDGLEARLAIAPQGTAPTYLTEFDDWVSGKEETM